MTSPVDALDWLPRTGATDRAVFGALFWCAELAGSTVFGASQRYLADVSGVTRATVRNSVQRLMGSGLVTLEKAHRATPKGHQSNIYRLHLPDGVELGDPKAGDRWRATPAVSDMPDLWRGQGGLPYASYLTWVAMPEGEWMTTAEVHKARTVGPCVATVRHHLKALHSVGLVDRPFRASLDQPQIQKWMRIPRSPRHNPWKAARALGVEGKSEEQADRHQAERQQHMLPLGYDGVPQCHCLK